MTESVRVSQMPPWLVAMRISFFDRDWYLLRNPDVRLAGCDPLTHFLEFGINEGRDPNPRFLGAWYLARNPDVARSGMHPLLHYLLYGAAEGRDLHPHFPASEVGWRLAS